MQEDDHSRSRHPLFARCYATLAPLAELLGNASLRQELLLGLAGHVVEIGAGNGLNFGHYPESVVAVAAVEPEAHLRRVACRAARRASVPVRLLDARAERLPLDDASCDAAVASLVLCSVADPGEALAELHRVLRPGGELRFYEHIRGGRRTGAIQDLLDPAWSRLAGGCHLNRDTPAAISAAGFRIERVRRVPTRVLGIPLPGPAVLLGRAYRL